MVPTNIFIFILVAPSCGFQRLPQGCARAVRQLFCQIKPNVIAHHNIWDIVSAGYNRQEKHAISTFIQREHVLATAILFSPICCASASCDMPRMRR